MDPNSTPLTLEENSLLDSYYNLLHSQAYKSLEESAQSMEKDYNTTSYLTAKGVSLDFASGVLLGLRLFLGYRNSIEAALEDRSPQ